MNETLKTISSRNSIRKFTKEPVEREKIEALLKAAMNAPSACNQQVWRFMVVEDKDKLFELSKMHGGIHFLKDAPAGIIVCGEINAAILDYFWTDDCAAATQNILLAANSIGLGTTWSGINQRDMNFIEYVRNVMGIPDEITPFSIIAVGYPAETKDKKDNYDARKVHYDKW